MKLAVFPTKNESDALNEEIASRLNSPGSVWSKTFTDGVFFGVVLDGQSVLTQNEIDDLDVVEPNIPSPWIAMP